MKLTGLIGLMLVATSGTVAAATINITNEPKAIAVSPSDYVLGTTGAVMNTRLIPLSLIQGGLSFVPQFGALALTNWGQLPTNVLGNAVQKAGDRMTGPLTNTAGVYLPGDSGQQNLLDAYSGAGVVGFSFLFTNATSGNALVDAMDLKTNGLTINVPGSGLGIGDTSIASSNLFQTKNAQGRYTTQSGTNGYMDWGTNHQMRLDTSGNLSINGQFNGSAAGLTGTLPNGTFPSPLPAVSAAQLTNVLRAYITPFDCGAVGDNVTDDTAALQKWIFIASQSNWVAYLPPAPGGAFVCSQTLMITNGMNHINILGTGGSIFVSDGAQNNNRSAIRWTAAVDGIRITNDMSNIRFDGIRLTNSAYSYATHGIWFDGTAADNDLSSLKSVECDGWGKGLTISSAADTIVDNCNFGYCGDGVLLTNGTYSAGAAVINQVSFRGCQLSYCFSNSINITRGQYIVFDNCDLAQGTLGSATPIGLYAHQHGNIAMYNMHMEQNSGQQPAIILTDEGTGDGNVSLVLQNFGIQAAGGSGVNSYSIVATNSAVWLGESVGLGAVADNTFPVIFSGDPNLWRSLNSYQARIVTSGMGTNAIGGSFAAQMAFGTVSGYLREGEFLKSFNFLSGGNFVDSYLYYGTRVQSWSGTPAVIPIDFLAYFKDTSTGGAGITSTNGFIAYNLSGFLNADQTSTSTTFAQVNTHLNAVLVSAGHKYRFMLVLLCSDSTAADGVKVDFAGGGATATNFRVHGQLISDTGTIVTLAAASSTTLAGVINASAMATANQHEFRFDGTLEPSGNGTFMPRIAQNAHSTGTLTIFRGSNLIVTECP